MTNLKLNWISPKLKAANVSGGGRGLFALEPASKDETLVVYGGHVMITEDFCSLPEEIQAYPYQIRDDLFMGPASFEEVTEADFLNHSCNPNAGFRGEITLVAMRNIDSETPGRRSGCGSSCCWSARWQSVLVSYRIGLCDAPV